MHTRSLPRLALIAALATPGGVAFSQTTTPAVTPLRTEAGVGVPSSIFDKLMPYHYGEPATRFGRYGIDLTLPARTPSAIGVVAPAGRIVLDSFTQTKDIRFIYLDFFTSSKFDGVSAGNPGDVMPALRDIPFNIVFFSAGEPTPYGIELKSIDRSATGGQSAMIHQAALVKDPDRADFLDRNNNLGFRSSFQVTTPLSSNDPANIIYRERHGIGGSTTEGVSHGTLPAGDYAVSLTGQYTVSDGGNVAGSHGIVSTMQAWVVIGKVAGWKEGVSGAFGAPERWAAQQQPQPDFRVFFTRRDALYTVTGISGTVARYEFAGGNQTVIFDGGATTASEEIIVTQDEMRLAGSTFRAPLVTVQGGGSIDVHAGGHLIVEPDSGGNIDLGVTSGGSAGGLIVQAGGEVQTARLTLGSFSIDNGDAAAPVFDPKRVQAAAISGPLLQVVEGVLRVGPEARTGSPAVAVTDSFQALGSGTRVVTIDADIDKLPTADRVVVKAARWENVATIHFGKTGLADVSFTDGARLDSAEVFLGDERTGNSTLDFRRDAALVGGTVHVGRAGIGRLNLAEHSVTSLQNMVLGELASGQGSLLVDGASTLDTHGLIVGRAGNGLLDVSEGSTAVVQSLDISSLSGSSGTVNIRGSGTRAQFILSTVGFGDDGLLDVSGGALFVGNGSRMNVGARGTVKFRGGNTVASDVGLNLEKDSHLEVIGGASIAGGASGLFASVGSHVLFDASPNNDFQQPSTIDTTDFRLVNGSTATFTDLTISGTGKVTLAGAGTALQASSTLLVDGALEIGAGAQVRGVGEFAQIGFGPKARVSGRDGSLKFTVVQNPFGVLLPGASPGRFTIIGDYVQGPGGVLELEIGGTTPGVTHDQLVVTGKMTLNGTVVLKFVNGFVPAAGQKIDVLDIAGDFTGAPRVEVQGVRPGWEFNTSYSPVTQKLVVNSFSNAVAETPLAGGDTGDADGDGLANLVERAFGTDPLTADGAAALPRVGTQIDATSGKRFLTLTYQRALGATDTVFTVEASGDLTNWESGPTVSAVAGDPLLSADGATLTVTERILPALDEAGAPARRFARLKITR